MIFWGGVFVVALSFGLSLLGTAVAKRVAWRLNFLDIPQKHKAHASPTPLLGGSAIFFAILAPSLLGLAVCSVWAHDGVPAWLPAQVQQYVPNLAAKAPFALGILGAALGMHILGLIDDRKHLGPWIKLIVQFALAAIVVVFCDVRVLTAPLHTGLAGLDAMLEHIWLGVSIAASILWLVLITNSFNFLDNMDGLAVGIAAICAAALLAAAASIPQYFVSAWLCLLLGALLGYLPYNFPPASSFMGDAGSLVIGFLLGVVSCLTTFTGGAATPAHYAVLVPVILMAVPLYDTCSVIILRVRERRNPMIGDRRHFSHRLVRRGMSVRTAVLTIYLCTAATAIAATILPRVDALGAALLLAQTLAILTVVALLESGDAKS